MPLLYIGLALVGGYLIISGLATLCSVLISLLAVPFGLLHDITQKITKSGHRARIKKYYDDEARKERELNEYFERKYFEDDGLPKSGTLDANGIPYL